MSARVLVIEDEPDVAHLIQINLELDGYEVVTASDGASGLNAARSQKPDLILLDIMLPQIDGWDVLMQLKGDPDSALSTIPVVVLTARSDTLDRLRGGIEGAIRYLTKPFSPGQLRDEVAQALAVGPEPARRRKVQQEALSELARLERGDSDGAGPDRAHPHLTRLEPARTARHPQPAPAVPAVSRLQALSPKQHELLRAVATTMTVSEAADRLSVSRSNVYASLRRIARKLGVRSVTDLVHLARMGELG